MSRSLRRTLRSGRFDVTLDRDFHRVILACADREETWINAEIERAMLTLHASGHAHSIEVWQAGELVGGLYGVKLGRAFFGESMFSRVTDASKVALAWLIARMKAGGYTLLDCQFMTPHLASLGAISVPRRTYVALLSAALGGGVAGSAGGTAPAGGGGAVATSGAGAVSAPDFCALERLLDATGAAGASGPAGYVIAQLLGQTS
jgi:leucyl/phenylalanyl-tRNA--protein transferase